MANWKVEERLTGTVVYAYGADAPDHFDLYPLATYNHSLVPDVPVVIVRNVTNLEFLKRFTSAEYSAFKTAASQNTDMDFFWQKLMAAQEIDLDDPETVAGVNAMESLGLLAAGRATEILA